jgi:hypothetical protein
MNVTKKQNTAYRNYAKKPITPTPTIMTISKKHKEQRIGDDKEEKRDKGKNVSLKKTKNAKRTHLVSMSNSKAATPLRRNGFVSKSHFSRPKSHF